MGKIEAIHLGASAPDDVELARMEELGQSIARMRTERRHEGQTQRPNGIGTLRTWGQRAR